MTIKIYKKPPIRKNEVIRYACAAEKNEAVEALYESVASEAESHIKCAVAYREVDLVHNGEYVIIDGCRIDSRDLAKSTAGASRVLLFAATAGLGVDLLIRQYSRHTPSRSLMISALGSERVETLCDTALAEYESEHGVKLCPRFSAGYGDLSLVWQKFFFEKLNLSKIGMYLNESLLITPSKSVTAFVGIK